MIQYFSIKKINALLAQLDRAFGYGPKGQGFESLKARQKNSLPLVGGLFFFCKLGIRTGGSEAEENSPVDCFCRRGRVDAEHRSESLKARQKRESHIVRFSFFSIRALRDEDPEGFVEAAEKAR